MHITIERSGGFTGMTRRNEVDTSMLAPEEARRVERLARAAEEARPSDADPAMRDAFEYRIEIDGRGYVVRNASEAWSALIEAMPETREA